MEPRSEIEYGFRGNCGSIYVFVVSIPNDFKEPKTIWADSKWIFSLIFLLAFLNLSNFGSEKGYGF